jgi:hypothetical protein
MTKKTTLMALAIVVASATVSFAGTGYPMKCGKCGFEAEVLIGGGMMFEQMTGFCVESGKFVYLQWERGKKKPEPVAEVWDSSTGKTIELYKFPECPQPIMPLQLDAADQEGPGFNPGFKHCPKCGKPKFQVDESKGIMAFD